MSATQPVYEVYEGYGPLQETAARREFTVARAFPAAGHAGRHLRLLEQIAPQDHEGDAPPAEAVDDPGRTLKWLGDVYSWVFRRHPDGANNVLFSLVLRLLA